MELATSVSENFFVNYAMFSSMLFYYIMRKTILLGFSLLLLVSNAAFSQNASSYTLRDVVERAKAQSPESLRIKTQRENMYWRYKFFRSNYNPQLRLNGILPSFRQEFSSITQPDGDIEFLQIRQNLMDLGLGLQQVFAPTGGLVSVNTSTNRFDNFLSGSGDVQTRWQGTPVNVRVDQPLFAYNRFKWDQKIEPLVFEESKREYVEQMERLSGFAADLFFDLLDAQINLEIANTNLTTNEQILKIEKSRYELGMTFEDKLLQTELNFLTARQEAAQARLNMETSALRIKSNLGLNEAIDLKLITPEDIPDFDVDVDRAIELAFQYRADAMGFDRRKLEADAQIAEARGERFRINLSASYGFNNAALNWRDIYNNPNTQALVNLGVSVPVLDWGRNKARMSLAEANKTLVEYTLAQDQINFEQEIFTKVKNFLMLKDRLEITRKSDEVAQKRYDSALKRYQTGNVSLTDLDIAQRDKDSNKRAYIKALREYWLAYFELRQLTLYDFESKRLLYIPELD